MIQLYTSSHRRCTQALILVWKQGSQHLHSSTGDEEPLVDAAVNGGGRQVLAAGDGSELGLVSVADRVLNLGGSTGE